MNTVSVTTNDSSKLDLLIIENNEEMRDYIRYCLDASKYKRLLEEGKLNVSEITYQAGFASIQHFSK